MRMKKFFICCIAVSLLLAALPVTQVQALSLQKGFDVSSKNGVVDWEMVAESDMDFVMLRTGEGQAPDVDEQFEANYEGAKAAGLKVGVYHVCCVRTPEALSGRQNTVWRFWMEENWTIPWRMILRKQVVLQMEKAIPPL